LRQNTAALYGVRMRDLRLFLPYFLVFLPVW
jgi:hypothetical protein